VNSIFTPGVIDGLIILAVWAVFCSASGAIARILVRCRIALLPPGPDAERTSEELSGMLSEFKRIDQLRFALSLYIHFSRLQAELERRGSDREDVELLIQQRLGEAIAAAKAEWYADLTKDERCDLIVARADSAIRTIDKGVYSRTVTRSSTSSTIDAEFRSKTARYIVNLRDDMPFDQIHRYAIETVVSGLLEETKEAKTQPAGSRRRKKPRTDNPNL
jgi:hypothetical protein